jgi:hypothetical protein
MRMAKCGDRILFGTIRSAEVKYRESKKERKNEKKDDYAQLTGNSRANAITLYFRVQYSILEIGLKKLGKPAAMRVVIPACIYVSHESSCWVNC